MKNKMNLYRIAILYAVMGIAVFICDDLGCFNEDPKEEPKQQVEWVRIKPIITDSVIYFDCIDHNDTTELITTDTLTKIETDSIYSSRYKYFKVKIMPNNSYTFKVYYWIADSLTN